MCTTVSILSLPPYSHPPLSKISLHCSSSLLLPKQCHEYVNIFGIEIVSEWWIVCLFVYIQNTVGQPSEQRLLICIGRVFEQIHIQLTMNWFQKVNFVHTRLYEKAVFFWRHLQLCIYRYLFWHFTYLHIMTQPMPIFFRISIFGDQENSGRREWTYNNINKNENNDNFFAINKHICSSFILQGVF